MEKENLIQQLKLSKIKIILKKCNDFAGTPEEELQLFVEGGIALIESVRKKKFEDHNTKEYYRKLKDPIQYPIRTALQLSEHLKMIYPAFVLDEYNLAQFTLLCQYFTGDIMFEKQGFNLKKGICLVGGVGVGKTTMMKMFNANQIQSYLVRNCLEIAKKYATEGGETLNEYSQPFKTMMPEHFFGHPEMGICFDDLGTENAKKHFGNDANVMAEIVLGRYDSQLISNTMTHLTTNLTPSEIEEKYGTRVRDRIREMFNVINFDSKAPTRRK